MFNIEHLFLICVICKILLCPKRHCVYARLQLQWMSSRLLCCSMNHRHKHSHTIVCGFRLVRLCQYERMLVYGFVCWKTANMTEYANTSWFNTAPIPTLYILYEKEERKKLSSKHWNAFAWRMHHLLEWATEKGKPAIKNTLYWKYYCKSYINYMCLKWRYLQTWYTFYFRTGLFFTFATLCHNKFSNHFYFVCSI